MNNEETAFINKIRAERKPNIDIFNKNIITDAHDTIIKAIRREPMDNKTQANKPDPVSNKINSVKQADIAVRKSISDLVLALADLGDKEIAVKLISDHIFLLKDVFDNFEGIENI